jgi:type IV pilus assembly protein PilB
LLTRGKIFLSLEKLGFSEKEETAIREIIIKPHGIMLVTGPTGSGKSTSLYAFLSTINSVQKRIITIEEPVEYELKGINQISVRADIGLTFAMGLRHILRQDPNVIMVGEIRDLETAEISVKAAQTGHLVLSTLHTNDAPTTVLRLLNMGVAPFNVASSVLLITAQRLGRKLCVHCKKPKDIPAEALIQAGFSEDEVDGTWQPFGPVGCEQCKGTGYKGRIGVYQVMPITDDMRLLIMRNGNAYDIAEQAQKEGVRDLRQSGLIKVKQGVMSLEEVEAITNE